MGKTPTNRNTLRHHGKPLGPTVMADIAKRLGYDFFQSGNSIWRLRGGMYSSTDYSPDDLDGGMMNRALGRPQISEDVIDKIITKAENNVSRKGNV